MKITSKGGVTIPREIREKAGLLPNTEVRFVLENDAVRILRVDPTGLETQGARAIRRLRGTATEKTSTEAIMALTRGE